ncbi:MAG: tRNA pseudouridine(55) synthase TruB [Lachnospiraceae bacterium]|uniref:tRNA pseudouridine(55) synthase TruB n=1 Tax=Roseburia hominis TaxID=301301 RepID=UPI001F1B01A0|nr:tRNA pseudouridine(55) synthase TruB [Roseburia hominis]MCI5712740.1 tRNA pseudouridine(55) synthase TruB [Lachnospiraceae bacterium]MDD6169944.1 tRNA pseudouridine(55) synthase TruB [Lachnospiraceae bacterium]
MTNGIINVYKEKGFTSFDVVAKLRGIFKQKKIGHTGTLDPDATGVLPVCLGKATRVCDLLTEKDKEYEAVLLLGKKTDTGDISGTVLEEKEVSIEEDVVRHAILSFVGEIEQVPPMYSALKVNGQKLCDLARQGITIERKARKVKIYEIQILEMNLPRVRFLVSCSKGTYIRTLCEDIGGKLGLPSCMESLVRTRVADFTLDQAYSLSEIEKLVKENRAEEIVQKTDVVFKHDPAVMAKQKYEKILYNGNRMKPEFFYDYKEEYNNSNIRVYDEKKNFIGIYKLDRERMDLKPIKIFME